MWPEIQDSLEDGEVAFDRPDLCARVFRAKLTALMDMLVKGNLLGDITYVLHLHDRVAEGICAYA